MIIDAGFVTRLFFYCIGFFMMSIFIFLEFQNYFKKHRELLYRIEKIAIKIGLHGSWAFTVYYIMVIAMTSFFTPFYPPINLIPEGFYWSLFYSSLVIIPFFPFFLERINRLCVNHIFPKIDSAYFYHLHPEEFQKQQEISKMEMKSRKIMRKCYGCDATLAYDFFYDANLEMGREMLAKLWLDDRLEFYCCKCLKNHVW